MKLLAADPRVGVVCSACGGKKYRYSIMCVNCREQERSVRLDQNHPTERPRPVDVAWAAGVYEGEGTCSRRRIQIGQKDRWLVERLQALFGGRIHWNGTVHLWEINGQRAFMFADAISPYLSPRRLLQMEKIRA